MNLTFKTPKGTDLTLLNLKGKAYLPVAARVQWWREENPTGSITTERVEATKEYVIYKATIYRYFNNELVVMATAHKREDFAHFLDANEKAETSAIGRALALCGYGTQFALELDEEHRIVDSPVETKKLSASKGNTSTSVRNSAGSPQESLESKNPAPTESSNATSSAGEKELNFVKELLNSSEAKANGWDNVNFMKYIQQMYGATRLGELDRASVYVVGDIVKSKTVFQALARSNESHRDA